jgi:hypothetical protein
MKNSKLFIVVIFLGSVFINCTSEPSVIPHPLNGVYEGTSRVQTSWISSNKFFPDRSYSEQIRLEITYPGFKKTRLNESDGCNGTVTILANELKFDGGDCGCWCDCSLFVDCGGDIILGTVQYEWKGDSLIMFQESEYYFRRYIKKIDLVKI